MPYKQWYRACLVSSGDTLFWCPLSYHIILVFVFIARFNILLSLCMFTVRVVFLGVGELGRFVCVCVLCVPVCVCVCVSVLRDCIQPSLWPLPARVHIRRCLRCWRCSYLVPSVVCVCEMCLNVCVFLWDIMHLCVCVCV